MRSLVMLVLSLVLLVPAAALANDSRESIVAIPVYSSRPDFSDPSLPHEFMVSGGSEVGINAYIESLRVYYIEQRSPSGYVGYRDQRFRTFTFRNGYSSMTYYKFLKEYWNGEEWEATVRYSFY